MTDPDRTKHQGNATSGNSPQIDPGGRRRHPHAAGPLRCRDCGRPHDVVVRCLPDGRWFDAEDQTWRDDRGRRAAWPDVVEYASTSDQRVSVRLVNISSAPKARPRSLCRRCHMLREVAGARLRALKRRALGDLFLGIYDEPSVFERIMTLLQRR